MQNVCVLGGGPVGCALAATLRTCGYNVDIYERYPDIRKFKAPAGRSINLVLTKRGLKLAAELDLDSQLLAETVRVEGRALHNLEGDIAYQPYGQEGECNYSIDRSELNKFWISEAERLGARFFFDHQVSSFDPITGDIGFAHSDGSESKRNVALYGAVFASDGGGSVVRQSLGKHGLVSYTESMLSAGYKEVVFPPTASGEHTMDPHALHIWPRRTHMLMALANTDGSFTGTIYLDHTSTSPDIPTFESACASAESAKEFLSSYYPDALKVVPVDGMIENFISFKQGHLGTVKCSPWTVRCANVPVCLIGDAAHAIVPFFGQGVNCGFEDVLVLRNLILSCGDLAEAICEFSRTRKVDSDAIADLAVANFEEMRAKTADPKFNFLKKLDAYIMDRYAHKYRTRYTLVMYSSNPYSACKALGDVQAEFLEAVAEKFALSPTSELNESLICPAELEQMIDTMITPAAIRLGVQF